MKVIVGLVLVLMILGAYLIDRGKRQRIGAALPPASNSSSLSLRQWRAVVDANTLPAQRVILTGLPAGTVVGSKVGGTPYWTNDRDYPTGANGQPLTLLAQINFAEIQSPLDNHPSTGLLQFFINADDLYGLDWGARGDDDASRNKNFSVVFHDDPDPSRHVSRTHAPPDDEYALPFRGESGMTFERFDNRVSPLDYRFEAMLPGVGERYDQIEPLFNDAITPPSHQLGGYAVFTQTDPRTGSDPKDEWMLLLQLDSEDIGGFSIMWGDVGIGNFFIRPEDLAARDFSRVWYNWDCH